RLCYFFFFQAEDGIRDFHVTGVQTCALPILTLFWHLFDQVVKQARLQIVLIQRESTGERGGFEGRFLERRQLARVAYNHATLRRSEERRVGKERGWRWAPNAEVNNGTKKCGQ